MNKSAAKTAAKLLYSLELNFAIQLPQRTGEEKHSERVICRKRDCEDPLARGLRRS